MIADWLRTGPDTMPDDLRTRLQRLKTWESFKRAGWVSKYMTCAWLDALMRK